jgi:hypothetical protein
MLHPACSLLLAMGQGGEVDNCLFGTFSVVGFLQLPSNLALKIE